MTLFYPPENVIAKVFATLPKEFCKHDCRSAWADAHHHGAMLQNFIEGPSFDRAGNLFVVDIPFGRIFRISLAGDVELFFEYGGQPNGLKFHQDGRIFIADFVRGILVLDPVSKRLETLVSKGCDGLSFKGVNDLHFARNGDLYFTDQGFSGHHAPTGRLYRLNAQHYLECILDGIPSPNGLALNRREDTVFVNVTRANAVWRVPLGPDGRVFKVGTFIQLSGGGGPDGLAMDEDDGLAVAHLGLGCVWLFNRNGEPTHKIKSPVGKATTNLAYRGATLFITESETGSILTASTGKNGLTPFGLS